MQEITVGVTGASGSLCARRLLAELAAQDAVGRLNVVISSSSILVAREELRMPDASPEDVRRALIPSSDKVRRYGEGDLLSPLASGSHLVDATCIVPCSTGTLGAIASGSTRNLIHRAAEVALKERRKLILGVRESPFNEIHLRNMLTATRAGAIVLPITPAFYSHPRTIEDVVELYAGRVLDLLGLDHDLGKRWGS